MKQKNAYVFLDKDTEFQGVIKTDSLILEGKIDGTVHAGREIHLKSGAFLKGEIHTSNFFADRGSRCRGELFLENPAEDTGTATTSNNGSSKHKNGTPEKGTLSGKLASLFSLL